MNHLFSSKIFRNFNKLNNYHCNKNIKILKIYTLFNILLFDLIF